MNILWDLLQQGGPVMVPLVLLSVLLYERCFGLYFMVRRANRRLRGDDVVRVKRLKPPWINSTAANTPPRRALQDASSEPPAKRRQTRRRAADAARARTPTQDHDPSRKT